MGPGVIRLRGGGKESKSSKRKRETLTAGRDRAGSAIRPVASEPEERKKPRGAGGKKRGGVRVKARAAPKKPKKTKRGPPTRGKGGDDGQTRSDRLQLAIGDEPAGGEVAVRPEDKAVVKRVKQLGKAMASNDDKAVALVLDQIAAAARKAHAPKIWSVGKLGTDGLEHGGSSRQLRIQRAASPYSEKPIRYDGSGRELARLRTRAVAKFNIPNPTDEVLGIDQYTELKLALRAANATRVVPVEVNSNRELAKIGKTVVGGMVVPEDVAVKWWLTKKREKRAKENAIMAVRRTEMTRQYATMAFMFAQQDALAAGKKFDPEREEAKALETARYYLEIEPAKQQKELARLAKEQGTDFHAHTIVKEKRRRAVSTGTRKGPKRALHTRSKARAKTLSKGAPQRRENKGGGKGFGSQRKRRSGDSGGASGSKRFRKRTSR